MKTLLAWLLLAGTAAAQALPPSPQGLTAQYSAACAAATCATWNVGTASSIGVSVTGAGSWTVTFKASADGGNTYFDATLVNLADGSSTTTVTDTQDGTYALANSGITHLQVRMTTWASGGANVWAIRGYSRPNWLSPFLTRLYTGDGTCPLPAWSFANDKDLGVYRVGANNLAFCANSANLLDISTTRLLASVPLLFTPDNAVDIGASGATRPRNVYIGGFIVAPNIYVGAAGAATSLIGPADGVMTMTNVAGTDFSRLQFGGTTSSFVAAKRVGAALYLRLADDSAAGGLGFASLAVSGTAPTIASGGCTSPAVTWSNGTATFLITIGTSCTGVKTFTLTMPAATNLWAVDCTNNTSDAAQQTNFATARATSTTAVVVTSYDRTTSLQEDFTAGNTYLCKASGG